MRASLLTVVLLFASACALPLELAKDCGIPGINADRECVELAFEKKWKAECEAEGYLKKPGSNEVGALKTCMHRRRIISVWDEWLSE